MNSKYIKLIIIRTECTNKNMGILLQKVRETRRPTYISGIKNDEPFLIQEYVISVTENDPDIITLYSEILKKGVSLQNYFMGRAVDSINFEGKSYYIFDLVYAEDFRPDKFENMQDTIFLQYLLLVLNRLSASNIGFNVFISRSTGSLLAPHSPLSYSDSVAKMRTFLSFCAQTGDIFPEYSQLIKHFRVFYQYKKVTNSWSPFFSDTKELLREEVESEPIGRIVPFIPINCQTYLALLDVFDENMANEAYQNISVEPDPRKMRLLDIKLQLFHLYENYLDRYIRLLPSYQKLVSIEVEGKKRLPPQIGLDVREHKLLMQVKAELLSEESETNSIHRIVTSSKLQLNDFNRFISAVQTTAWETFVCRLFGIRKTVSPKQLTACLIAQEQLSKKDRGKYGEEIKRIALRVTSSIETCEKNHSTVLREINTKLTSWVFQIREIIQADSILERLLFMATLSYLEESEIDATKKRIIDMSSKEQEEIMLRYYWGHFSGDELSLLHEFCVDYAQGIFQAIENAWFHVIKPDEGSRSKKNRGCGGLTIRVRRKEDMQYILAEKQKPTNIKAHKAFCARPYFLEIYVTDLQYTYSKDSRRSAIDCSYASISERPFESVVRVFYKNIQKRAHRETGEDEAAYNAAQGFINNIIKGEEYDPYLGTMVPVYNNRVTLRQLFGAEESEILTSYLQNEANIAYHYGLQILSNVVETGNGYMMVRSGEGAPNFYSSDNEYYRPQNIEWKDGTAYVLFLPIGLKKQTNYQDTLAVPVLNNSELSSFETYQINLGKPKILEDAGNSVQKKNEAVNELRIRCSGEIINKMPNSIFIIDCMEYKSGLDYEVLAKAVFRCAAQDEIKKTSPVFALVNVKNRHEVVKLFRQFALFYNRHGECPVISNDSAFFIIDRKAELDILLRGNTKTITENLYLSQIYGGVDLRAMQIMEHLGSRWNSNG